MVVDKISPDRDRVAAAGNGELDQLAIGCRHWGWARAEVGTGQAGSYEAAAGVSGSVDTAPVGCAGSVDISLAVFGGWSRGTASPAALSSPRPSRPSPLEMRRSVQPNCRGQ